jgi:hypothetical protein
MKENPYEPPRSDPMPSPFWTPPGPGSASIAAAAFATVLLVFAASHARVDRTHRRPVVSWTGPAAAWVDHLAVVAWLLSLVAGFLACRAMGERGRQSLYGVLGLALVVANVLGSCLFGGFLYED